MKIKAHPSRKSAGNAAAELLLALIIGGGLIAAGLYLKKANDEKTQRKAIPSFNYLNQPSNSGGQLQEFNRQMNNAMRRDGLID